MGVSDLRDAIRELPVTADEDEFDPFAGEPLDPPPAAEDEGDDRVHEGERDA